jgi:Concanavalin A-like lectin/glucanases superfamily/Immunoglobulin domain/Immunoglobulin I-set domain
MKTGRNIKPITLLAGASLCTILGLRADYPAAVNALGPVEYYRLSTTNAVPAEFAATNIGTLGTAFNGRYVAMSDTRGFAGAIAGDSDTSVSIDASAGAEIVVPNSPVYNPSGAFSVEFWANPANTDGGKHAAVISMVNGQNLANGNDRSGWAVQKLGDQWQFVLGFDHSDGSTFYATTASGPNGSVVPGVWQHIVAVYTPGASATATLYVNGVQVDSQTLGAGFPLLPNTLAPLLIGNRGYGGWNYIGLMDEVAIYTNALTAGQVQAHYAAGTSVASPSYTSQVSELNPPIYLRLGEPSLPFPVAVNDGSWGAGANGAYRTGTTPGAPGLQAPAATGFGTNNPAVALDGTNGYVRIPAQTQTVSAATIVAWVKRNGRQSGFAGIVFQRSPNANVSSGLSFQGSGDALTYNWNDAPAAYNFTPDLPIPDQTWTFVAATIASDQAVLYVGGPAGLKAATNAVAHDLHDFSDAPLDIGWDSTSNARLLQGEIDEVAVFNKALTYDQISGLFKAALPSIVSLTRTPADPVYEGSTVTFTAGVDAVGTPTYQWRKGGSAIQGQTASTLVITGAHPADGGDYDVVVKAGGATLTSDKASLVVISSKPVITLSPTSVSRFVNGSAAFSVAAIGTQPITAQWSHGSDPIPGATNTTLTITDLQQGDGGDYTVTLTNPLGTANATATLTLATPGLFASAVVDGGPLGYWPLNEATGSTAFDVWGGRDGVVDPAVTVGAPGPSNPPFKGFSSTNTAYGLASGGVVTVPALNLNKNTMTIVTWINPSGAEPDFAGLVFSRTGNTVSGLDYNTGQQIGYHWNNAADTYNFTSGLIPATNAWNFVALVVEPEQATLYLDAGDSAGLQSSVNTVTHAGSSFEGDLKFGLDDNGGGRAFTGGIGPVAIFDRSLSTAEITALRNAGVAGTYTGPVAVSITQNPRGETLMVGDTYSLSAKAAGTTPITYQWQKDGMNLPGAIRSSLTLPGVAVSDSGSYRVVATQGAKQASSQPAVVQVNPVPDYLNATNGLVLHLKFDGDYTDASGRGNNGTPEGSPSIIPGKIGSGALQYSTDSGNMVYNYVTLGSPADLQFGDSTDFTVAYWIKFSGLPGDLPFLSSAVNSTYNNGITFAASYKLGGWNYTLVNANATVGPQSPDGVLNDGQWHSLVHTFNRSGNAVTYLDGVIDNVTSIVGLGSVDNGNTFNIGQDANGTYGESAVENIDDLGIWRRALTQFEAESIYVVGSKFGRSFDVAAPPTVKVTITATGTGITLGWPNGVLQSSTSLSGPWTAVAGAAAPSYNVTPSGDHLFYRVLVN